jgi:putative peptidoglycan lipid II flippase
MSEEIRVARHAGIVGAATLASRVLGLIRELVMASLFGAGFATDAFNVAFRIPNLLRDLFAEGAMSSAFVPTFTEHRKNQGDDAAWALGRQLLMTLLAVLSVVVVVGWLITPLLVRVMAPGFATTPGKLDLTVQLTRVMLPFLPAVALAAAAMGMLNARGRFGVPALAPALLNVGMIGGGLALLPVCRAWGQPPILAMALGVLIGGIGQFVFQLPALHAEGFRPRFEWPRLPPGVRRVGALMVPATFGLAATQLNLFVSTLIASLLVEGSVSWLWYAFRLMQLPIGVFGVALATVSLPALARAAVDQDRPALATTLSATVRLVFALTIPASLWLAVMAHPLVALLYEHGAFDAADTTQTARALVMYSLGLPAFAAIGILIRAFYALGDTAPAVRATFGAVGVNLGLNLLFIGPLRPLGLEHLGLALATSVTAIANLLQLGLYLRQRVGPLEGGRMLRTALRMLVASALAVAPSALGVALLGARARGAWIVELGVVAGSLALSGGLGVLLARVLAIEELPALRALAGSVLGRLRR